MAILSFKKRFAGKVRNGRKRQTIRGFRKYPIKPGDKLYLYTALRTKWAKKLREVWCKSNVLIHIYFNSREIILPDAVLHTDAELNAFARADGFKDFDDMKAFWIAEHGVKKGKRKVILRPFKGTLIKW
jgi:hypothetical protein